MHLKINFILLVFLTAGCSTNSVQESTLIATDGPEVIELTVPASKVKMIIPKNDLVKMDSSGSKSYRYFIYSGNISGISISGWFEPSNQYQGVEKHWNDFLKNWSGNKPENVVISNIGQWETISYNLQYKACNQQHIKSFLVKADTWIELHISYPCDQVMDIKTYLEEIRVEQKS
ncbi:MAG: hypothetical protein CVV11_05230 [Gammaproteobacteria bacterium HGW-Gammaproteobacteria-15]|nr:MAG: hypothetical protein CVV11_05230 [Gammaproteobacteria bacterium HGW-Gammaproteobacteria-15]